MKRPSIIHVFEILLFLFLTAGAMGLLVPVSSRLNRELIALRDSLVNRLETETGLGLSYKSLSPSILKSIEIRDLVIRDASDSSVVASVAKVSISYDIFALIRGDLPGVIREIVLENGSAGIDRAQDAKLLETLYAFAGKSMGTNAAIDPSSIRPLVVRLKNFDVAWKDSGLDLRGTIGSGQLSIGKDSISLDLDSRIRCAATVIGAYGPLSARIRVDGSINREFDTGTATLMLTSLEGSNFSLPRLGLVTSLRGGTVSVSSVQDLQPMDIKVAWNIKDQRLVGSFNCDRLYPLQWVQLRNIAGLPDDLRRVMVSGSASLAWSVPDGLSWSCRMDTTVPSSFYGGFAAKIDCAQRDGLLNVNALAVNGPLYDMSYAGTISLDRFLPDGFLSVKKCVLPTGANVSGDMYIERVKNRSTGIIPVLSIGDSVFSGIELTVANSGSLYDFALSGYDSSGHINVDGSLSSGSFIQCSAAFDSISVANGLNAVLAFGTPDTEELRKNMAKLAEPYLLTTEVYFSTNFADLSFNCNRLVIASAEKDGLYALFSVKGTQKGIDITDIEFAHSGYAISGNVFVGLESSNDVLFDAALSVNSLPYNAHGMFSKNTLSLYGDYGLAVSMLFDRMGGISGSFAAKGLPIPVGTALFSVSFDAGLAYASDTDWKLTLYDASLEDVKGLFPLSSVIACEGEISPTGVNLNRLSLSDQYSRLSGYAKVEFLPGETPYPQANVDISLSNRDTKELCSLAGRIAAGSDPSFEGSLSIVDAPLMRFVKGQTKANLVSLRATCSGPLSNIVASADVEKVSYQLAGFDLEAHAKVDLANRVFALHDSGGSWNGNVVSDLSGSLSLDTMGAALSASYRNVLGDSDISSRIQASFIPGQPKAIEQFSGLEDVLGQFTVKASLSETKWKNSVLTEPIECSLVREKGITAFYAGKNDAVSGFLLDDGTFSLQTGSGLPVSFVANGSIVNSAIDVAIDNFHADLPKLWPWLGLNILAFSSGTIDGDFGVKGLLYDPDFSGTLSVKNVQLTAPGNLEGSYAVQPFTVSFSEKSLAADPFIVTGKGGSFIMDARVLFDRWFPVDVAVSVKTMPGDRVKVKMTNALFKAEGSASCDLSLIYRNDTLGISGTVLFEQGAFAIDFVNLSRQGESGGAMPLPVHVDLNLAVGKKVEFRWPNNDIPIIRGLVQADEPFAISLNTADNTFRFKGAANFKGGEILYVKRSFYLREGSIAFNENQDSFNPMINLKAEVRERDTDGNPVRVILSVNHQPLMNFTPVLSSDPAKSNLEILALLGQAVVSDASQSTLLRNTVVSASDLFTQFGLFRNVENTIRDVSNLDIFSIRTLLLQNALFGTALQGEPDKQMTFGNYFDNTTVYMGKYLGSAIYADALMHFSYYDPKTNKKTGSSSLVYGNLLFQPEFGAEVATPLFFLRWGITPSHPETLFIADHSITLSWKFSY